MQTEKLKRALEVVSNDHFKLIVVVGPFKSGKTTLLKKIVKELEYPCVNLNLILTNRLMQDKEDAYATKSQDFLKDIFDEINSEVVLVDNIELLFSKEIGRLNPIDVFKNLARDKVIVLSLPSKLKGDKGEYSTPDRSDYMLMDLAGLTVVKMEGEANG